MKGSTVYATVMPELEEQELEKTVSPVVKEYFEHGDTKEVQVRPWSEAGIITGIFQVIIWTSDRSNKRTSWYWSEFLNTWKLAGAAY